MTVPNVSQLPGTVRMAPPPDDYLLRAALATFMMGEARRAIITITLIGGAGQILIAALLAVLQAFWRTS